MKKRPKEINFPKTLSSPKADLMNTEVKKVPSKEVKNQMVQMFERSKKKLTSKSSRLSAKLNLRGT